MINKNSLQIYKIIILSISFLLGPASGADDTWSDLADHKELAFELSENEFAERIENMSGSCNARGAQLAKAGASYMVVRQRPRSLKPADETKLKEVCGGVLYYDTYLGLEGKKTCCSPDMVYIIKTIFDAFDPIYANCPACQYNLRVSINYLYCFIIINFAFMNDLSRHIYAQLPAQVIRQLMRVWQTLT